MTTDSTQPLAAGGSPVDRGVRRLAAVEAFNRWRDGQPYGGATDKERRAFLAGFNAAIDPPAPTESELMEALIAHVRSESEKEAARRAALPPGVCPECDGDGQVGGQFCGGFHDCEACAGTGRTPNQL
jgi:hypothetical protein